MQLAQAKTLGVLNHHQRGIGHVHPHFNHGGADQQPHGRVARLSVLSTLGKLRHRRFFVRRRHARMQQAHLHGRLKVSQCGLQFGMRGGGVGQVQGLAFFYQRAHPVHLATLGKLGADTLDHLGAAVVRHHLGHDGAAPGGQGVDGGHIQIGVIAHGQGARNGGGRHHQQMGLLALAARAGFVAQGQPLRHAKAVLLVNDGQPQLVKLHVVLNHRVGAHHQMGLA